MKVELLSITPLAEGLIESAGRTCYQSKPKEDYVPGKLIKSLIKMDHLSVLEHASATFRISGVSRSCANQLVRHRIASYSQQSQRYCSEKQFDYVVPPSIKELEAKLPDGDKDLNGVKDFKNDMQIIQNMYNKWKARGLKNEDARSVLPGACCTEIVMTANMREWRSIIKVRCDKRAQWEIRELCEVILERLYSKCPNIFEDLKIKFIDSL